MPGVPSQVVTYDPLSGINSVQWKFGYAWTIGSTRYDNTERGVLRDQRIQSSSVALPRRGSPPNPADGP